jgi:hypothetical protein
MTLEIHERDIDPELCQACAACCRITFKVRAVRAVYENSRGGRLRISR